MREKTSVAQRSSREVGTDVVVFTGSRSEWGLLEPLAKELKAEILVSGSHLSLQFGFTYSEFKDKYPCYPVEILTDSDSALGVCKTMGLGLISLSDALVELSPAVVVILGDRYEALACALSAFNLGIPIAHIEGTDITTGSSDNEYRRCIDVLAALRFPVDLYGSLGCVFPKLKKPKDPVDVIVAYHPYKDWSRQEYLNICKCLDGFSYLDFSGGADAGGRSFKNLTLTRQEYLSYLKYARFIIGNSSSGIIEAPSLGVPTVNVGNRQGGRWRADSVIDCGSSVRQIKAGIKEALKVEFPVVNPYEGKDTINRITKEIQSFVRIDLE